VDADRHVEPLCHGVERLEARVVRRQAAILRRDLRKDPSFAGLHALLEFAEPAGRRHSVPGEEVRCRDEPVRRRSFPSGDELAIAGDHARHDVEAAHLGQRVVEQRLVGLGRFDHHLARRLGHEVERLGRIDDVHVDAERGDAARWRSPAKLLEGPGVHVHVDDRRRWSDRSIGRSSGLSSERGEKRQQ
jgi:hypothetical protein